MRDPLSAVARLRLVPGWHCSAERRPARDHGVCVRAGRAFRRGCSPGRARGTVEGATAFFTGGRKGCRSAEAIHLESAIP